jgi:D-3-phosphoglycerate dehydrogenase
MSDMLPRFKAVLTDPRWPDLRCEEELLSSIADLHSFNCQTEEELILNCADADALLVTYAPITRRVIDTLKKCQVISVYAIGLDMVDVQAATEAGIPVTNVPGYCIEEVCDHAMALLLAAARKVLFFHQSVVQDGQWRWQLAKPIYRLRGKTLGLIGFGKIPRAVAARAMSFGLRVMTFDPYVTMADCDKAGVAKAELDDLLPQADFVSIHAPLTPETKGLMNMDRFRVMKRTAVIINTSRGPVIEEKDLVKALEEGWIAGAALDVLDVEPPKHNPFIHMKNVILTPHAGFYSEEAVEELRTTAALEVRRVLTGQQPDHLVNPGVSKYIKRR